MVVHTYNNSTWEAGAGRSQNSISGWANIVSARLAFPAQ